MLNLMVFAIFKYDEKHIFIKINIIIIMEPVVNVVTVPLMKIMLIFINAYISLFSVIDVDLKNENYSVGYISNLFRRLNSCRVDYVIIKHHFKTE